MYRNATDFWMLTLYPVTLLNLLNISNSLLVKCLGFSTYKIMSHANRENYTSSSSVLMPFISFSYLTALVKTSSIMNRWQCVSLSCSWSQRKTFQTFTVKCDVSCGPIICSLYYAEVLSSYGIPSWLSGKESTCQCSRNRRHGFDPWVGKILWRRKWQPTPIFLPGKFHQQRSLVDYSLVGPQESDVTERLSVHTRSSYI